MESPAPARASHTGMLRWAGFLLGLSLGGFFDGILLHQVLQWHHLLSNVQQAALQDVRMQLLADGLFHVLMYLIAGWGLYLLWRGRAEISRPGADRNIASMALIGFGVWHVTDSVLSHWITGIHRIRVDSANPLLWDLLWFFAFGVVPLMLGWRAARRGGGGPGSRRAAGTLAGAALLAGPIAAWPPQASDEVLVMFRPGMEGAAAFNALARVDARVLWVDRSGGLWAVSLPDQAEARRLYTHGALLVSNSVPAIGCFSRTRTAPTPGGLPA